MMQYAEQPTPPFNSPYQTHASRSDSLLQPPYLSPARDGSMSNHPQGLGLYNYHHQLPAALPSSPSPSPSNSWSGHVSAGASPLMTQALADPYSSGAFEHPIIRSPQPWSNAEVSPRSSVSSVTMVPVYPHNGSDHTYHEINQGMSAVRLEGQGWITDVRYAHAGPTLPSSQHHPLTVAPERLNSTTLPYDNTYDPTRMARYELATVPGYENQSYDRPSVESSPGSSPEFPATSVHRQRKRNVRQHNPSQAAFRCYICDKGFARQYNYKMHLQTHDPDRKRPHVCHYEDCRRGFVRALDLNRHITSVHKKQKDHRCRSCPSIFARKDTCSRHEQDGCNKRGQVDMERYQSRTRARL